MSASVTISPIPSNRWVGAPLLFAQVHWSPASWSSPPKVRQSGQKARGNRGQYSRYSLRRLTLGARGEAYLGLRDDPWGVSTPARLIALTIDRPYATLHHVSRHLVVAHA